MPGSIAAPANAAADALAPDCRSFRARTRQHEPPGSGGGGLKEPKQGSFDKTIKEYDDAIAKAQKDFQELQGKFESVLASKFDIHLGTGGGSLPCWDFTALGQRYDVCLTQYAQELSVIRYVVLFIAAILAGWIVFYRS